MTIKGMMDQYSNTAFRRPSNSARPFAQPALISASDLPALIASIVAASPTRFIELGFLRIELLQRERDRDADVDDVARFAVDQQHADAATFLVVVFQRAHRARVKRRPRGELDRLETHAGQVRFIQGGGKLYAIDEGRANLFEGFQGAAAH